MLVISLICYNEIGSRVANHYVLLDCTAKTFQYIKQLLCTGNWIQRISLFPQISLACLSENKQLSVFRSLRTLRALRPLRAISRMEGMKVRN